jgi:HlyD family secretion protein
VVGAGGRGLNLVDLNDAYVTFFRSTAEAGRVLLGSEVRLVMERRPDIRSAEQTPIAANAHIGQATLLVES